MGRNIERETRRDIERERDGERERWGETMRDAERH